MSKPDVKYQCKNCINVISKDAKICPFCKRNLRKVGRKISLTLSEYVKLSDKEKSAISPENIEWDPQTLSFFGIFTSIFLGIFSLLISIMGKPFLPILVMSIALTPLILILVTKVDVIRILTIKLMDKFLS